MKHKSFFIIIILLLIVFCFGCKTTQNQQQETSEPILRPEDVFSQEILAQIRSHYNIRANEIEITYIGNHGYLISTLSKKILIDSLTEIGDGYVRTARVILTMLNEADFPFNNIELALTTHSHGDHFDNISAVEFLIANPQAFHLSTEEVAGLIQNTPGFQQISSQSMGMTPEYLTRNPTDIAGITVDIIRVDHHNVDDYEHLILLFTLNGIKILHVGDACKIPAQYDGLGLEGEDIDILIAPFGSSCANWTVGSEEANPYNIINQFIRPKHIIVSHLDFDASEEEIADTISILQDNLPGITFSAFHPEILKQKIYIKEGDTIRVIDKPVN